MIVHVADNSSRPSGQWYRLSGDQVGVLLARFVGCALLGKGDSSRVAILSSAVSTGMIGQMALDEGFVHEETLTGFKWMGKRAIERGDVLYAFEEALGYMWPAVCYDKDGIAAAAVFLRAVAIWHEEEGLTPWGKLQQLYERHGYFENMNTIFARRSEVCH
jgi:phosphoglucomutase